MTKHADDGTTTDAGDAVWQDLLAWLEKKGFDRTSLKVELEASPKAGGGRRLVAREDLHPETTLICLPASSLVNRSTLAPLYPPALVEALTANQLICLHLCLYRYASVSSECFIPYIRSLPKDLSTVPLWREIAKDELWQKVVQADLLPPGLKAKTADVEKRFHSDWAATTEQWVELRPDSMPNLSEVADLRVDDFVWAWLCVNSRCIWYDLQLERREDNITLAPIIDGNHKPKRREHIMQDGSISLSLLSSLGQSENPFEPLSERSSVITRKGDEIFYSYGAHADDTLLSEYGFVLNQPGNSDDSVDVSDFVEALFEDLPSAERDAKRELLESRQYLGDYHLTLDDGQTDVSYRLTVALSLLHSSASPGGKPPRKRSKPFVSMPYQAWHDLVDGMIDRMPIDIEEKVNASLCKICGDLVARGQQAVARLSTMNNNDPLVGMLMQLWTSHMAIANSLIRVRQGES